ncbi:hypothetical protein KW791_00415 [Candidatus Parcubacteria bacterium]|nr:hypothetical protein [Candidatus Parcubacteria bacterium]
MENQYSPAPWRVEPIKHGHFTGDCEVHVIASDGSVCAVISGKNLRQTMANAYLIAATPDLLEASKQALKSLHSFDVTNTTPSISILEQAIAKVERY